MNVVDLDLYVGQMKSERSSARSIQRNIERSTEADKLLKHLRLTKRVDKNDQPILVGNLGLIVAQLEPKHPLSLAEKILEQNEWQKRKRYILFPEDTPDPLARYAATGGVFARLIDRLIEETANLKGFSNAQAKIEIVFQTLKGTSFRRPSRFQMANGEDDAAFLVKGLKKVLDVFADEVDLAQYFDLVSKYPIYPAEADLRSSLLLELKVKGGPNNLYVWDDYLDEDELDHWIPWWAPKCVIGHLYIPFLCSRLRLSKRGLAQITENCGGEITPESWIKWRLFFLSRSRSICGWSAIASQQLGASINYCKSSIANLACHIANAKQACCLLVCFYSLSGRVSNQSITHSREPLLFA